MTVALQGPSPAALTAGILLLSRARILGLRIQVEVVGDPQDITPVPGPAILYSPVLAGCGVGRELGSGGLVIVPGPTTAPLATCLAVNGDGPWFEVDRTGSGLHPLTQAFVRLCRDSRPQARALGLQLRRGLQTLGCSPEPAVVELLFAAPAEPLSRLSLFLRAGRALSGEPGEPLTRYLSQGTRLPDALPADFSPSQMDEVRSDGRAQAMLDRLTLPVRDNMEEWIEGIEDLDPDDEAGYRTLACGFTEVASHLLNLPPNTILPPLDPAMDGVAVGLGNALGASRGVSDGNQALLQLFQFLGGRFTPQARYPIVISDTTPPEGRVGRWEWFCTAARRAASDLDALWSRILDPPQ